jgi:O-antigen/teichoic acid export membrane protein
MTTASRSIHWSKFFAVLATVLRLGGGLTSFLIQARFLGPYQFGVIGAAMTIAALTSLLSDFGLNTYAMHWGSAQPERRDFLIPLCVIVKAILSAMLLLPCLVWVHLSGFAADKQIAAALAIIGFLAAATGDVALVGLRVQSLFEKETIIVAWTTFVSLPLLIVVVIVSRDVLLTALAFAAGRAVYLVAALNAIRPTLAAFRTTPRGMVRDGVALLVSSKEYAVDLILTNCVNQIDVVIMSLFVDTVSIGLYMAATRLVQNGLPIVSMLATVYLPPLAGYHANAKTSDYPSVARRMNIEFFAVGIVACLCVIFIGPLATPIIFGPGYNAVRPLWPGFGVFVMLRILGTAYGTQLVAFGQIRWRVAAQIAALAFTCGALVLLLPVKGILAAPWILSGAALILLLSYGEAAIRKYNDAVSIRLYSLIYCAIAAIIFVEFWCV